MQFSVTTKAFDRRHAMFRVQETGNPIYCLGGFTLEPNRQLLSNGTPVVIGRKPLALLSVLAASAGGLVTKDELLATVWPGVIVEENALHAQIAGLRKLLGRDAHLLKTVRGIGYRLQSAAPERFAEVDPPNTSKVTRRFRTSITAMMAITAVLLGYAAGWSASDFHQRDLVGRVTSFPCR